MLINKDFVSEGYTQKTLLDFKGFRLVTNTNPNNLSANLEGYSKEYNGWECIVSEYELRSVIYGRTGDIIDYALIFKIVNKLYDYISEEYYNKNRKD